MTAQAMSTDRELLKMAGDAIQAALTVIGHPDDAFTQTLQKMRCDIDAHLKETVQGSVVAWARKTAGGLSVCYMQQEPPKAAPWAGGSADDWVPLYTSPKEPSQDERKALAEAIHYPDCWDTAAYPTLADALSEVAASFRCTNQDTHTQDERKALADECFSMLKRCRKTPTACSIPNAAGRCVFDDLEAAIDRLAALPQPAAPDERKALDGEVVRAFLKHFNGSKK